MADYTTLGIEKITQQAGTDIARIRCPRDGVVMRPIACILEHPDTGERRRVSGRPPKRREWAVRELDLECPACRRRATRIAVTPAAAARTTASTRPGSPGTRRHVVPAG